MAAALTAGEIPESVARTLCRWTDKLPADRREDADKILADAAVSGLDLADLAGLFAEMYEQARAEEPDRDREESFEDRALRLVTTLAGAGVLHGDLTPECAAAVRAVLDALSAPGGAEDDRTQDGEDAQAVACDAAMAPIVTGEVNPAALDKLVQLCVQLHRLGTPDSDSTEDDATSTEGAEPPAPAADTSRARDALEQAIIGNHESFNAL
ncbi:MAG: DUF222 domain-containing protein [Mycobacterium sp.]